MAESDRLQETIREIVRLFQDAHRTLATAKCRVTALAWFTRAQTMLDELEKHPDPNVARSIKEARAAARAAAGKDTSIHHRLQVYATYWREAL